MLKESLSFREHEIDEGKKVFDIDKDIDKVNVSLPEKDSYNKGDTIKFKDFPAKDYLTSNDIKIIKNGNTCYNKMGQDYKNLKIAKSLNKSSCQNFDRFEENKNLIDCGYATANVTYQNKVYQYFHCYHTADANADPGFKQFYNEFYSNAYFQELSHAVLEEFTIEIAQYLKVNNLKKRKLINPTDYDLKVSVEDRYGNIIIYDKNGKIIDDPTKILNSSLYSLNIFIFLLNLLSLL